jgi:hypothetical protein
VRSRRARPRRTWWVFVEGLTRDVINTRIIQADLRALVEALVAKPDLTGNDLRALDLLVCDPRERQWVEERVRRLARGCLGVGGRR